jgi:hypothetical protein
MVIVLSKANKCSKMLLKDFSKKYVDDPISGAILSNNLEQIHLHYKSIYD